jgi:hypothetical protein
MHTDRGPVSGSIDDETNLLDCETAMVSYLRMDYIPPYSSLLLFEDVKRMVSVHTRLGYEQGLMITCTGGRLSCNRHALQTRARNQEYYD